MRRLALAVLGVLTAGALAYAVSYTSGPLRLEKPSAGDSGTAWTAAINRDLEVISSSFTVSGSTYLPNRMGVIYVSTIGGNQQSNGVTFSSHIYMVDGASLTLQGPNGYITTASSVTASAFFGALDGSYLGDASVGTAKLTSGSVQTPKLDSGAVLARHILDSAVGTSKLSDGAVGTSKLDDGAVLRHHLNDAIVDTQKLASGSVTERHILDASVGTSKLMSGAVQTPKLDSGAVLARHILDAQVGTSKLSDGSVQTSKLGQDSVTASAIRTDAVETSKVIAGAIQTGKLAQDAVTSEKLLTGAVQTAKLADGAVQTSKIDSGAVLSRHLMDGAVGTSKLASGSVQTDKLDSGAVLSRHLFDASVGTSKLMDGSVGTSKLVDGAILSRHLGDGVVQTAKLGDGAVGTSKILPDAVTSAAIINAAVGTSKLADYSIGQGKLALTGLSVRGNVVATDGNNWVGIYPSHNGGLGVSAWESYLTAASGGGNFYTLQRNLSGHANATSLHCFGNDASNTLGCLGVQSSANVGASFGPANVGSAFSLYVGAAASPIKMYATTTEIASFGGPSATAPGLNLRGQLTVAGSTLTVQGAGQVNGQFDVTGGSLTMRWDRSGKSVLHVTNANTGTGAYTGLIADNEGAASNGIGQFLVTGTGFSGTDPSPDQLYVTASALSNGILIQSNGGAPDTIKFKHAATDSLILQNTNASLRVPLTIAGSSATIGGLGLLVNSSATITGPVTLAYQALNASALVNGSIETQKLAVASVQSDKLADGAVQTAKLGDGSVTIPKIDDLCAANQTIKRNGTDTAWECFSPGTGSGDVTAAGNNTFSGNNLHQSSETFNGGMFFPGGSMQTTRGTSQIGSRLPMVSAAQSLTANYVLATRYFCFDTFTASTMSIAMYSWAGAAKGKLAVYPDNAGHDRPNGSTVAVTVEITSTGGVDETYVANLTAPYTFQAGSYYWLAWISDTATLAYQYGETARTTISQYAGQTYADGFPDWTEVGTQFTGQSIAAFP